MTTSPAWDECLSYLNSPKALSDMATDAYWPKWDGPWWRMRLLYEMGELHAIPHSLVEALVARLNKMPVHFFPLRSSQMPEGSDPMRDSPCHCQVGTMYQVLSASGVDVKRELPWFRTWFLEAVMKDGGRSCDNDAYAVENEMPSSMVGSISIFEAAVLHFETLSPEEERVLEQAARFLMERRLILGSSTSYNADERASALDWPKLCFPRFYFYDILRGLTALSRWAQRFDRKIPQAAVSDAIRVMDAKSVFRVERRGFDHHGTTLRLSPDGVWEKRMPACTFPLLREVSALGEISPYLAEEWRATRARLITFTEPEVRA